MGNRLVLSWVMLLPLCLFSQISVKTNLPPEIRIGSEITFDAKIWKGPIKNFSKYQLEVPEGVKISEVDCKTGSFSQDENIVKIIWAITPSEEEFTITLKMNAGPSAKGDKTLIQRFFYLEKGDKKALELTPINITFKDSDAVQSPAVSNNTATQPANTGNDDMIMQVHQLQKDSKEALEVGEKEKQQALLHLKEADQAVAKAKTIANEAERKKALEKAMVAKDKAESDLAMANRILTLAQTLSENAAEMEKLNQAVEGTGLPDTQKAPETIENGTKKESKPSFESEQKVKQNAITKGSKEAKGLYKPISTKSGNIQEVIQQVDQIKKDARDARDLGLTEKRKAEQKLSDAYDALKKAEYIPDPEEKKMALEKAGKEKDKAEQDLEVASKVLTLSKSLEDNAIEIENVYNLDAERKKLAEAKSTPSVSPINQPGTETKGETKPEPVVIEDGSESQAKKDAEKLHTIFKEEPVITPKKPANTKPEAPKIKESAEPMSGTIYRVQVGSFLKSPDKSQFVSIGKVDVIKDGEKYKAYTGKCASREEASALRDKIKAMGIGIDAFVVVFKDGVKQ